MDTTPAHTAAAQLADIRDHFGDLRTLATTKPHAEWPPASLRTYVRERDEYDAHDHTAPIRLHILDVAEHIRDQLVQLADQIAEAIQRPSMSHTPYRAPWPPTDRARRDHLADHDAADPRRWHYTGHRTAPTAAHWLHARLTGTPGGPFRPLTLQHRAAIEHTAAHCAERLHHALGTTRRTAPTGHACHCGHELHLLGGDGHEPAITCPACGRTWTHDNHHTAA